MALKRSSWLGIPAVVWVGGALWGTLLVVVLLMSRSGETTSPKTLEVLTDAFKVGLGAFIAMLAQWANNVFGNSTKDPEPPTRP